MLCASGLDLRAIVRALPPLVRTVMPTRTLGVFWSTPDGAMADAFVEEPYFLSSSVLLSCQAYQAQDPGNWPSFEENVRAGPVTGYLLPYQTPEFYESDHYDITYRRIGVRHVLDAVIHDGVAPKGCLLFMRSAEEGPFEPRDVELARTIADLIAIGWDHPPAPVRASRVFEAGLLVADAGGRITFSNLAAHQSLWMLARPTDRPMDPAEDESLEALVRRVCAEGFVRARREGGYEAREQTRWGEFRVRYEAGADGALVVTFHHQRPFACHLAHAMAELALPPRRLAVGWLAVQGLPRKLIAAETGLSIDTVGEHLERLFDDLDVGSTVELAGRFST
jgi:DNA-binding CsgD family transcriptional regulator